MYKNLSIVYDKLMTGNYEVYKKIIEKEIEKNKHNYILDLGCGSGNLIENLSKYGEVFAVDNSEEMLSLASQKNQNAKYIYLDLLNIDKINNKFDFVISAFDVFNYLENFLEFETSLNKVYSILNKGGKFIFDIHTPKKINDLLNNQPFVYESDDISYLWFTYPTENNFEVESELTFFIKKDKDNYKKMYEFQKQRTYDIDKVIETLKNIGFIIDSYFCDFDENNTNYNNSDRIIFILRK